MLILNSCWQLEIEDAFENSESFWASLYSDKPIRNEFLETIWKMSLTAFEKPREIQVVIDSNNDLFMSVGSASFVAFTEMQELTNMKIPIKCWIHTHPFGKAYFSMTDTNTIDTWKPLMLSAIVLGDNEHQTWRKNHHLMKHYTYARVVEMPYDLEEE